MIVMSDEDDVRRKISKALAEGRVEFADQTFVEREREACDRLYEIVGCNMGFYSDESTLGHIMMSRDDDRVAEMVEALQDEFNWMTTEDALNLTRLPLPKAIFLIRQQLPNWPKPETRQ